MVTIPKNNPGAYKGGPTLEWYYRENDEKPWIGPMSYQQANSKARRASLNTDVSAGAITNVKYAQLGITYEGGIRVVHLYANGRQFLGGHLAILNSTKLPIRD